MKKTYVLAVMLAALLTLPLMTSLSAVTQAQVGEAHTLKLTDALHEEFLADEDYALADALLNATWKQVKLNVSEDQYKTLLQEQRKWTASGRDEAARINASSMPPKAAFIRAMQDRTNALLRIVRMPPKAGVYTSPNATFTVRINEAGYASITVEGNADNGQGHSCEFTGKGIINTYDWTTLAHDDFPNFYLLFTRAGAELAYATGGISQGCGAGVNFNYSYTLDK
ncbi:lysozyme inhibitor LprI family protein [uncultured Desulfovibrio sp.]|uniref:lysozyme inhibitor LprI family protein n=2 Tax=uncultured Desulfovibrio sp. TaxID=167968 RepID=UPI00286934B8|nr:lysozyme inhibitor LprI family protein [uncultured Desulfovibrio sp.]